MLIDVIIEETLSRIVIIEADTPEEGVDRVRDMYIAGEIEFLTSDDFDGELTVREMEQ